MTSTEIAIPQNGAVAERDIVDGWIAIASDVIKVANHICETDFVPKEYRGNPPAVAAAILTGRELGIGPMMSLRHVQIVRGVPTLSAEYKRARVLAAGHDFEVEELTITRCKVRGRRAGTSKWLETSFTMDDARRAKIVKSDGAWVTRPRRMLFARAGSELCDFLFADVTNGLPTAELVADGAEGDEFAGYDESPAQPPPAAGDGQPQPAPRTARRGRALQNVPPADAPTPPAPAAQPPAGGTPLPPLPGEEEPDPTSRPAAPSQSPATGTSAQPATPGEPDETDYDTAGTRTDGQLKAIWTMLSTVFKFARDEKDQARAVCAHIIQHPLESTKDLSKNEAKTVIDVLAEWQELAQKNGMTARDLLLTMMADSSSAGEQ